MSEERFIKEKLHDKKVDGISLKNSLRIILASADLSFATNYAGLTIVELKESSDWEVTPVFGVD